MGGDFDNVVGGVGMRLRKKRDHHFVDALLGAGLDQLAEEGAVGFEFMRQPQHVRGDGARLRAGEADYAQTSAARRSGDGDDGVVQLQVSSFKFLVSSCKGVPSCELAAAGEGARATSPRHIRAGAGQVRPPQVKRS